MMDTRAKIRQFIEHNLIVFDEDVKFTDSDNIFARGLVNSLFAMRLLVFVEEEFHLTVADEEIEIANFSSIDNIVHLVERKIGVG